MRLLYFGLHPWNWLFSSSATMKLLYHSRKAPRSRGAFFIISCQLGDKGLFVLANDLHPGFSQIWVQPVFMHDCAWTRRCSSIYSLVTDPWGNPFCVNGWRRHTVIKSELLSAQGSEILSQQKKNKLGLNLKLPLTAHPTFRFKYSLYNIYIYIIW